MSTNRRFVRRIAWLAGFLLVVGSIAFASDASVVLDATIFDVKAPAEGPTKAGVSLAFEGDMMQVHLVAEGTGTLPDVNLGFKGETPRIRPFDQVHVSAALGGSTKVVEHTGGVQLEHRNTTVSGLKRAYVSAMADLGFTLDAGGSMPSIWRFVKGDACIRVHVMPAGKNVVAYVGR